MPGKKFLQIVERLNNRGPIRLYPPLDPDETVRERLHEWSPADLFDSVVTAPEYVSSTVAGLLVWADCLDESHNIAQGVADQTGSYWHAIVHRREPDFDNARYWVRRVGEHPAYEKVYASTLAALAEREGAEAKALSSQIERWGRWNAEGFVGLCEDAHGSASPGAIEALETAQLAEIRTLLDWTRTQATSAESSITPAIG